MRDPLGGINSLWPFFGIANQLLAAIALCVATTILLKTHGVKYLWITAAPLAWLVTVTFSAALQKIFSPDASIGFLAEAAILEHALRSGAPEPPGTIRALIFNNRLDAAVCALLLLLVAAILADSLRLWIGLLRCARDARLSETPFVPTQLKVEEL